MPKAAYTIAPATIRAVTKVTTVPIAPPHQAHHIIPGCDMEHLNSGDNVDSGEKRATCVVSVNAPPLRQLSHAGRKMRGSIAKSR
jgi:hypothetical protein